MIILGLLSIALVILIIKGFIHSVTDVDIEDPEETGYDYAKEKEEYEKNKTEESL